MPTLTNPSKWRQKEHGEEGNPALDKKTNKMIVLKSTFQVLMLVGNELTPVRTRTQMNTKTKNKMFFCVENDLYIALSD